MEVNRFDADRRGEAVFDARWEVVEKDGNTLLREGRLVVSAAAYRPDSEAVIAAMSRTVADLSRDVAAAIMSLPSTLKSPKSVSGTPEASWRAKRAKLVQL